MSVTLITPTGGRPEAFALCERWISAQTYKGPMHWIVVDDYDPPTELHLGQELIRPERLWGPGDITQHRNLLLALKRVTDDLVLIIEDDDYYSPEFVDTMVLRLQEAPLVGEANARFYNVRERAYHFCSNGHHSSLSQTGFRSELIPDVKGIVLTGRRFIDMELWQYLSRVGKLYPCGNTWVGMKGMPGRPGLGVGHRKLWRTSLAGNAPWVNDSTLGVLRSWIGTNAEAYSGFYVGPQ